MLKWIPRQSEEGPYGKTGEDYCFKFECEIEFGGITIQSFREVRND